MLYDTIIVGSGAAGLSAGIYAGRYLMKTLIIRGEFGGETATAGQIWNYPGAPGVDGYELMKNMRDQAKTAGTEYVEGKLVGASKEGELFKIKVAGPKGESEYQTKTLIFAQGAERRHLDLPNEKELTSKGVHYCVTCDGPLYGGKTVAMVGGGDASAKGVLHLATYVSKIYMLVRGERMRAEPVNQDDISKLGDKVEILYNTQVAEIVGKEKLEKIIMTKEYNGSKELVLDGMFIEIGAKPDVGVAIALGVILDKLGYITVDNFMQTNVDGIYAAGDTVNHFGPFKQTITAAALGAVAATSAYNYHKKHG